MSTPFLNDAYVRSVLTRKIALLETSTRRRPSQSQVKQLNDLTQTYHGILATPTMQPETALGVLTKIAPPSANQPAQTGDVSPYQGLAFQRAEQRQQQQQQMMMQTLSNMLKASHETSMSIIQNLRG